MHAANQAALHTIESARNAIRVRDLALSNVLDVIRPLYEAEGEAALRGLLLDDEGTDDALAYLRSLAAPAQVTAPSQPAAESSRMAVEREEKSESKGRSKK